VERLWQALHETITRNHQCSSMWQLLKKVHHFMNTVSPFPGGNMGWLKCSGIRISYLDEEGNNSFHTGGLRGLNPAF
ncbi:IS630 family transposase, partial [Pantoea stewartii subsp. stewartii]